MGQYGSDTLTPSFWIPPFTRPFRRFSVLYLYFVAASIFNIPGLKLLPEMDELIHQSLSPPNPTRGPVYGPPSRCSPGIAVVQLVCTKDQTGGLLLHLIGYAFIPWHKDICQIISNGYILSYIQNDMYHNNLLCCKIITINPIFFIGWIREFHVLYSSIYFHTDFSVLFHLFCFQCQVFLHV